MGDANPRILVLSFLALALALACDQAGDDDDDGDDDATGDDDGGDDDGGDDDSTPGPECVDLLIETVGTATIVPSPGGPLPDPGVPFLIPETNVEMVRISDTGDPGSSSTFFTNGYSRFSPANVTGEYVTAFGSNGTASIYRLSDRSIVRTLSVGEPNELHWDSSGEPDSETWIYYRTGASLRKTEVLTGDDVLVHDFGVEFPGAGAIFNGVEGAPSRDMRYWAFQVCDSMTGGGQCVGLHDVIVYDLQADAIHARLSDVEPSIPVPNYVDISPSGSRIVVGSCKENSQTPPPWNGPYAWSLDFSTRVRLSTNCTHSGWAWGDQGEELAISFDSCGQGNDEITFSCDYTMAVDINDPSGWENRTPILYQGDVGWGNSTHMARIYDPAVRGWFQMSTYGSGVGNWAEHQLFFVEIVHHDDDPRLWRVGPTITADDGYWTEAFASLDFQAQHLYWGGNWDGADDLELYRAILCEHWWEAL